MTYTADKAQEIVTKFRDGVTRHPQIVDGYLKVLTSAIAAAIESARQDERERARRLVDAAKAVQELQPKVGESPLTALRRHKKTHEQMQVVWDEFDAALKAYTR